MTTGTFDRDRVISACHGTLNMMRNRHDDQIEKFLDNAVRSETVGFFGWKRPPTRDEARERHEDFISIKQFRLMEEETEVLRLLNFAEAATGDTISLSVEDHTRIGKFL